MGKVAVQSVLNGVKHPLFVLRVVFSCTYYYILRLGSSSFSLDRNLSFIIIVFFYFILYNDFEYAKAEIIVRK